MRVRTGTRRRSPGFGHRWTGGSESVRARGLSSRGRVPRSSWRWTPRTTIAGGWSASFVRSSVIGRRVPTSAAVHGRHTKRVADEPPRPSGCSGVVTHCWWAFFVGSSGESAERTWLGMTSSAQSRSAGTQSAERLSTTSTLSCAGRAARSRRPNGAGKSMLLRLVAGDTPTGATPRSVTTATALSVAEQGRLAPGCPSRPRRSPDHCPADRRTGRHPDEPSARGR